MSGERKHAKLSASAAHRWLNCPGSIKLTDHLPDTTSVYAEEGTLAHELAELELRRMYGNLPPEQYKERLAAIEQNPLYGPEMPDHIRTYTTLIARYIGEMATVPHVAIEVRLDFSRWVPEGFGTGDCLIRGGDTLHVIDFKYGRGVEVSAQENPQMMLYALGALDHYAMIYEPPQRVVLTVCQPRLNRTSEWEITPDALTAWGEEIKPIANAAFEGSGELSAGEWCRFCKIRSNCTTRTSTEALQDFAPDIHATIDNEELARRIQIIRPYVAILKDMEEQASTELFAGRQVPGFKLVEGRSTRRFTDMDAAFQAAQQAGIDEALLYERKAITLTALEKVMGKKVFNQTMADYIEKPQGAPTLVPDSDKRPDFSQSSAAHDFAQ